jgi:uncharacterized protein YndB with AHSA1/START domain
MIQQEISVHLNQPVERVFAFLTDSNKLTSWQSNLIKIEPLVEGPLCLGSRFREVRRMGRKETEIEAEITAFELNRHFETRTLAQPEVRVSYSLEPEEGGTHLRHRFTMRTHGMMRLMEPLIAGSVKRESEADFSVLKNILDQQVVLRDHQTV